MYDEFVWPKNRNIRETQESYSTSHPPNTCIIHSILRTKGGLIWNSDDTDLLQLQLCIISQSNASGLRLSEVTAASLCKYSTGKFLHQMCEDSFKHASISFRRQEGSVCLVRLDQCYKASNPIPLFNSMTRNLERALRDDHSNYKCLVPFSDAGAGTAAQSIVDCCMAFGTPVWLISDST